MSLLELQHHRVAQLDGAADSTAWGPAGILGAVIFVITGVVQLLRRRMVETEALAEQRGVDLRNLAELNEYMTRAGLERMHYRIEFDGAKIISQVAPSSGTMDHSPLT